MKLGRFRRPRKPGLPLPGPRTLTTPLRSPRDTPCRYSVGSATSNERVCCTNRGRIREENQTRSSPESPRSRTFGRRTHNLVRSRSGSPAPGYARDATADDARARSMILVGRQQGGHLRLRGLPRVLAASLLENLRHWVLNSLW